jgi:hypothetical protein
MKTDVKVCVIPCRCSLGVKTAGRWGQSLAVKCQAVKMVGDLTDSQVEQEMFVPRFEHWIRFTLCVRACNNNLQAYVTGEVTNLL